ncbi:MAG: peptidylprolyl isomerase [Candidatus Marinimicrobia bacterium]|nr:peptidylprolyl isomerase [Candidatus Neomarinimicrobiota bacterium]
MKQIKIVLPLIFSSAFAFLQEKGANTSFDEPLTIKEKKHLQAIDGLAAIVGDKIILKSDINQTLAMTIFQRRLDPQQNTAEIGQLKNEITNSIINRKVILAMAELDSVVVQDKEVDRALESQLNNIIAQAGSEKAAEKAIGQPLRVFRREYWYDIKDMLVAQKYQQGLISKITVNKSDVHKFFNTYKDSIPPFPTTVKIRHLLIEITPNQTQVNKTVELLKKLRQNILDGLFSFEEIASQYTQDPGSKNSGGSLGFVRRGNLVTEFEAAAFTLQPGEISLPVKTEFGYHIIETQEIRGDKIKVRHILMSPPITDEDEIIAYNRATFLKDSSATLPEFINMIKFHSADDQTKATGGSLGWINPKNYPIPEFGKVIEKINHNECAGPVRTAFGYHLLWIESTKPGGAPNLTHHWNEIEKLALGEKKNVWFSNWVVEARKNFFIDIAD